MTHSFKSYAQNFEDVILYRALGSIRNGFYVDVGAQHPEIDSVSKAFYDLGWRGVHVEPVPYYAELLRKHRPGDLVIEAALSSFTGEIAMTVFPLTGLSTVVERVAEEHILAGNQAALKQVIVPTQTLAMVADEVGCQDVHWLKIDVEGHEISVLKGLINNLSQNKCLILIEIADDKFKIVNDFLVGNNYKMIFKSHFRLDYIYSNL